MPNDRQMPIPFTQREYPHPGKTPENTPRPRRASREELNKAARTLLRECRRLEVTSMSLGERVWAKGVRQRLSHNFQEIHHLRLNRRDDEMYDGFERG